MDQYQCTEQNKENGIFPIKVWFHNIVCEDVESMTFNMYNITSNQNISEIVPFESINLNCKNQLHKIRDAHFNLTFENQNQIFEQIYKQG